jgi:hypothetical protein
MYWGVLLGEREAVVFTFDGNPDGIAIIQQVEEWLIGVGRIVFDDFYDFVTVVFGSNVKWHVSIPLVVNLYPL